MRTLITFLLSACCCAAQPFTFADQAFLGAAVPATAPAACATGNTTNAWDNLLEGFQSATGYDSNSWTHIGTVANITSNYNSSALSTYKPAGACDQCLRVTFPASTTRTYAQLDLGAAIDLDTIQTDVYFSFYISTNFPVNKNAVLATLTSSTTPSSGNELFYIRNTDGTTNSVGMYASSTSAYLDGIEAGQWYVCKLSFDTAAAANGSSLSVWSNNAQVGLVTFQRKTTVDLRYLMFGAADWVDSGDTGAFNFDLLTIKTP